MRFTVVVRTDARTAPSARSSIGADLGLSSAPMPTMSREKPRELYALRYMTRFQCIADRCEDTCCAMMLTVDAREMNQLETAVGATEAGKAVLEANVERRGDLPDGAVAMVRRRADN